MSEHECISVEIISLHDSVIIKILLEQLLKEH